MRLWSIHPEYLDKAGLLALWREALLAKHVLEGKTKGYKNHPQLNRFKESKKPIDAINQYLSAVYDEAVVRNYNFDSTKINWDFSPSAINVTSGQIKYEMQHLLNKLKIRDIKRYKELKNEANPKAHPLFKVIDGEIEEWERTMNNE